MKWLLVFFGGGIGSLVRLGMSQLLPSKGFPFATLLVNCLGSLLIGLVYGYLQNYGDERLKYLVAIGFCGGLTTFSTFSNESFVFLKSGDFWTFIAYIVISVVSCLVCVRWGYQMFSTA